MLPHFGRAASMRASFVTHPYVHNTCPRTCPRNRIALGEGFSMLLICRVISGRSGRI